jgi:nucleoside-diphosphate-sugar epimerase
MKTIAVFGASGLTASECVYQALKNGDNVIGLTRYVSVNDKDCRGRQQILRSVIADVSAVSPLSQKPIQAGDSEGIWRYRCWKTSE